MAIKDLNPADAAAAQARLIGDGAHDVAGLDPIPPAHFDAEALHVLFRLAVLGAEAAAGGGAAGLAQAPAGFAAAVTAIAASVVAALAPVIAPVVAAHGRLLAHPVFVAMDQQGGLTHGQPQGRQGELVGSGFVFLADPLQDFGQQGQFLAAAVLGGIEGGGEFLAQQVEAVLVDRGVAGHLHRLDRPAHGPLQAAEEAALPRGEEQDRVAGAAGPAGAADPVDVGLRVEGDVVVHHQGDAVHIQAPGGHIGGHEHVHMAALESINRAFPLALGHVAVEHGHVVTLGF